MVPTGMAEISPEIKNGGRLAHFKMTDELWGANVQASHIQIRHFELTNLRKTQMKHIPIQCYADGYGWRCDMITDKYPNRKVSLWAYLHT